jgi:ABC-type multidrug transport system fused ATPase/permease subunit
MQSTLGLTLLRLIEPDCPPTTLGNNIKFGRIFIDGVDISTIPLSQLRSAVGCVPQEPVIFGGLTVAQACIAQRNGRCGE